MIDDSMYLIGTTDLEPYTHILQVQVLQLHIHIFQGLQFHILMRTHLNQRNLQQSLVHSNLIGDPRKCKPIDDYQSGKRNVFDNGCER